LPGVPDILRSSRAPEKKSHRELNRDRVSTSEIKESICPECM